MEGEHHKRTNLKNKRAMEIERLKTLVALIEAAVEELRAEEKAFSEKKSEWYYRNLTLNYSGLMTDDEFQKDIWNKYQEYLHSDFGSDVFRLKFGVEHIIECYEKFKRVEAHLDEIIKSEENRIPDGWKTYEVSFLDKANDCNSSQQFYAPSPDEAKVLCKKLYGSRLAEIKDVKEVGNEEGV